MAKFGGEIGRKYGGIDLRGRETARRKPNEIKAFPSFESEGQKELIENRFNVSGLFNEESLNQVQTQILDKLKVIAKQADIELLVAGKDFPLHSTLEEGEFKKENGQDRNQLFSDLKKDPELAKLIEGLDGLEIEYKYILVDKGNVLLTAVNIPKEILDLREKLTAYYSNKNLKPVVLENILHISLARMTGFPESEDKKSENLKRYEKQMIKLRHEISANPIKLKIEKLFAGSTSDLLHGRI